MADDDADRPTTDERPTQNLRPRSDRDAAHIPPVRDRYSVGETIGRGGMGEVVAAHDENIGREVAIKRMLATQPSQDQVDRFLREARIQGRLDHPAIPPVYDLALEPDGRPFFAMKRLTGTTLSEIFRRLRNDPATATKYPKHRLLRAFADVCLAIELAHTRGVIHRDLKPSNIMLGDFGEVFVLDWGVAKVIGAPEADSFEDVIADATATVAGSLVGTPGYMAPEQLRGQPIDARSDVYALGCLLFEILAGVTLHPPGSTQPLDDIDTRPSLRAPAAGIAPELDDVCAAATAARRDDRIATARDLGERVQRFLDGDRDLAQRRELAKAHLARALASNTDDDRARGTAMREASRALALDPTLDDAADLIGRLVLTPPASIPPEVTRALAAEGIEDGRRLAKLGLVGHIFFIGFIVLFSILGLQDGRYLAPCGVLLAINLWLFWRGSSRGFTWPQVATVCVNHALLTGLVGRMMTPILVAPGLAMTTLMGVLALCGTRTYRTAMFFTGLMLVFIAAPWIAEDAGLVSHTMRFTGDAITLHSPMFTLDATSIELALALYTITTIGFTAVTTFTSARANGANRARLHLQAWQLRHLVPDRVE